MPHPKKKHTSARTHTRRAHHALSNVPARNCPQCKRPVRPHHVCTFCGTYKGVQRIKGTS